MSKTATISIDDGTPVHTTVKIIGWLIGIVATATAAGVAGWLHLEAKTEAANAGVKSVAQQIREVKTIQAKDHDLIVKIDGSMETLVDLEKGRLGSSSKNVGVSLATASPSDSSRTP